MKKFYLTLLVLSLIFSVGLFSKEMKTDHKVYNKAADVHQLGRAPLSNSYARTENNFTLAPNIDTSRYDFDVYTGNTTGLTYNAVDLATGALTPTGAIVSDPFPMCEEYDGNAIYRVYNNLSFVEVNPDDGTTTALGTVTGIAGTPTGLAYDWASSTMYIVILDAGNAPHLGTLNLTTLVATEIGVGTGMFIAMDFADDGYLYAPAIDDDNLYQIDPATGASTLIGPIGYDLNYGQDVTFDYTTNQLYTISCGEAYILGTYNLTTGALVQIADMGGNQHAVLVSTVASADPGAPAAPTDVFVIPDAGGALEVDIDWVCPTLQVNGDPLTDLDEMRVYRDDVLIYTDSAPVIGGPGNYTDVAAPSPGQYIYKVVGYNDFDEGIPVSESVWVGEDVPNVVTDLLLEDFSTDTDLIAHLSWVNPTVGLHGGPFNEPILGYHVLRSDGVTFELTGILTEWTDDTIPAIDYYSYSVTPYNSSGDGATAVSNTSLITTANVMFADDFSGGMTNWNVVNNGGTTDWMIYDEPYPNTYTMPATSLPPVMSADADAPGSGTTIDSDLILANPIDCSAMIDVILEFDSDFNMIDADDWGYVDVSVNGGTTWTNVLTYQGADYPAVHEMLNISEYVAGFTDVLIKFHSVQPGWDWWWTIDNVMVSGTEGELGAIVGTVTDAVTTNPIVGAIVDLNGTTQTTNASGYYEFATVFPGTYTLICTADGYYDGEEESIVLSGQTTTTDFAMDPYLFGALDGTVTDADTGLPLIGAEINAISDGGYAYDTVTNNDGYYFFVDVVAETYDVFCSFPNYPTEVVEDVLIEDGLTTTVDFQLEGYTYWSDFENNDGGLISDNPAGWQWGIPANGPTSAYSGVKLWGTVLNDNYPAGSNFTLDTPMPFFIESPLAELEFWHWYDTEASFDGGNVKVSADGGTNWTVITPLTGYTGTANTWNPLSGEPIFDGHDQGFWEFLEFDLSGYIGQSIIIRWHFGSDSSIQYPGWFIDDVSVSGASVPDQGWLEGTVTEFGTGNPIEGAVVSFAGTGLSATTLADGTYDIQGIWPGDYDITCVAPLYLDAEELGFTIVEGLNTLDFSLLWSEISVNVTELTSYLPPDETEVQTFTITNAGPGELEYNISFEYPEAISVRQVSNTQKAQNSITTSNITNSSVVKKTNNSVRDESPFVSQPPVELIRDMWDLQFSFDATAASGGAGNAGAEFDGTYFYSTRWLTSLIHKYDINGILVSEFSIPGVTGLRDLAYDGTHFYGGTSGNTIYEMDFETQTLIGTITSSVQVRAIAYDSDNDAFYVTNWADPIGLIARDGTTISTFNCGLAGTYGMAYDNVTGGPYLWIYDQGAGAGTPQLIHQFDLTTNTLTGISHDTTLELPDPSGPIAGGLFLTTDYESGFVTIGGLQQGIPDQIFCYELAPYSTWVAVTNNISGTVPGNGGSIVVDVTFDATDLTIGEVLTADLLIHNNANYIATRGDDYVIPVTLTVTGFIPPSNLYVDLATWLFTWDAPPGPDLLGYKVFLDDMINQIGTTTATEWQYEDLVVGQAYVAGVSAVYADGESIVMEYPFAPVAAGDIIPLVTELRGNFPNPFNPDTQIAFSLNKQSHVQITIYNVRGQLVRTLVDEQRDANNYTVTWNGTDDNRKSVSSGIYFYKMKAEKYASTKKMILMK